MSTSAWARGAYSPDRSVPEPDLVLLEPREDEYERSLPTAADVLLAVEVSDATVRFDLRTKAPLYAGCGVTELWVVDVNERVVHLFRDPGPAGYATSVTAGPGETARCVALPVAFVEVRELFPD